MDNRAVSAGGASNTPPAIPIYLSGCIVPDLPSSHIGYMLQPGMGNRPAVSSVPFALDNGCFTAGESFSFARFYAYAASWRGELPLFVVAPDVVGDASRTYARWSQYYSELRSLGFPLAYVLQNGQECFSPPWDDLDAVFIGGDTGWKQSIFAAVLVAEARMRGKWVHMGRVNSRRRYRLAAQMGCHSCDGTLLAFGPQKNLPRVVSWMGGAR